MLLYKYVIFGTFYLFTNLLFDVYFPASDLAGGGMDDMKLLEQRAQTMAAEAEADKPKLKKDILFVR